VLEKRAHVPEGGGGGSLPRGNEMGWRDNAKKGEDGRGAAVITRVKRGRLHDKVETGGNDATDQVLGPAAFF